MKKAIIGMGICVGLLSLAGCSKNETHASHKNSKNTVHVSEAFSSTKKTSTTATSGKNSSTSSTIVSSTASSESQEESTTSSLWTTQKASELQQFMESWGTTMKQTYREYTPNNNVNFYGLQLPEAVLGSSKTWGIDVKDVAVSAEWSTTGESSSEYSIVAVYSDAETSSGSGARHLYFFGFNSNQPVVLVSMQNQGMEDHALHFKQTENQALTSGFQNIVAGQPVEQPTAAVESIEPVNTWASMDEAIQFYEDTYKNTANEVSQQILWENYHRSCWSLTEQAENRMVLHWKNIGGAGGSYVAFEKFADHTTITQYDGNNSYPNSPSKAFNVRNSDHTVY